ncbi:YqcC family protein [Aestuariirhabdus sp. Z084]|uniref:YqcC family protein n=1 Tax=Aestuariirhabdus haliotis TaxID=2918751 RepID=UPI00201B36F4|nr:YqcC family protein [Aestuariirhabdus haliotis]MCL6417331.1 YqcC family protein [Aestuariirhabdus haliotis]MCL6421276.1 YqcC family protein [Aestuariirhabdus haliotis]
MDVSELSGALNEVEAQMRALKLWQGAPPPAEAFASREPFCIDTMGFDQWLQWVFIGRLRAMLDAGAELPGKSELLPLADEFFKGRTARCGPLLSAIAKVDRLLTQG